MSLLLRFVMIFADYGYLKRIFYSDRKNNAKTFHISIHTLGCHAALLRIDPAGAIVYTLHIWRSYFLPLIILIKA
ncbi:hypothetical protein BH23THE1_BH23THE1_11370 [soil metagenome]